MAIPRPGRAPVAFCCAWMALVLWAATKLTTGNFSFPKPKRKGVGQPLGQPRGQPLGQTARGVARGEMPKGQMKPSFLEASFWHDCQCARGYLACYLGLASPGLSPRP